MVGTYRYEESGTANEEVTRLHLGGNLELNDMK